jgi:hypothetical protein
MQESAEQTGETVVTMREQATTLAREIAEQAATKAMAGAEKARELGSSLAADSTSRVREVPHKVSDDVVPTLRDLAIQAASAALELWQVAREKAAEAADAAQAEVGDAAHLMGAAEKRARDAGSAVADRVDEVGERAKEAKSAVTGRVEEVGGKAKEASAHAVEATVSTGKDTGATILWAGAAAAVIFYVMLNQERRDQLLRAAESVIKQSRELIRDFQGYDEEFA